MNLELETEDGNQPSSNGGTHIGTHHDTRRFHQRNQTRIHETDCHHGGGRRRLDSGSGQKSGENADVPVLGHRAQNVPELRSRCALNAFTHDLHPVDEEGQ